MKLNADSLNMRYNHAVAEAKQINSSLMANSVNNKNLSFKGLNPTDAATSALDIARLKYREQFEAASNTTFGIKAKNAAVGFFESARTKVSKFVREYITEGVDVTYANRRGTLESLRRNFGDTFNDCFDSIELYNNAMCPAGKNSKFRDFIHNTFHTSRGKNEKFICIKNENDDLITFHKDPFLKNVCHGIKEFTVGTFLDICIAAKKGFRKLNAKFGTSDIISSSSNDNFFNRILNNRESEKRARDAFYKLAGVFEQVNEGVSTSSLLNLTKNPSNVKTSAMDVIDRNIRNLAKDSIEKASRKVGNYNTKSERAWNRLGTGFVSAIFAATDFYNISMLQNNDTKKADESGKKRFWQDMRRQGITAGITYVILGAFQNKVNKSLAYAAFSLGGVTLISEILSRMLGGISLTPLSPEDAAKVAEKREKKEAKQKEKQAEKEGQIQQPDEANEALSGINDFIKTVSSNQFSQTQTQGSSDNLDVFRVFTDKVEGKAFNPTSFTANKKDEEQKEPVKKKGKKADILSKAGKFLLGAIAASLTIGFLRSRNVLGIDSAIKSMSVKYNDFIEKATRRRLIMSKDDVDGFLDYLSRHDFNEQYDALVEKLDFARGHGPITGQSNIVRKFLPEKEINPTGLYYDLGFVEHKGKKTALNILLYPFNTVNKLLQKGNNLVKLLFGIKPPKVSETTELSRKTAVSFVEKYANKYKDALSKNITFDFRKEMEDAFSKHFSEANSQNKNTSLAMVSRFLITLISGYFFVNDYRNEVLIESKGKDVERANATMKERIGHKIANFFLNSMFMDMFNTTFEPIYLSSVAGATAVAMATEVTNETVVRASICTPTSKMTREELIEFENERLGDKGLKGDYYRTFMKLTGKKPLSEKAKK